MQDREAASAGQARADRGEVEKFNALAQRWWDRRGPMRPLHAMNPARTAWIVNRLRDRFGTTKIRVLDVGCGAGLLAESLARAGCAVTGIDAASDAIEAARAHAAGQGLAIDYRTAESDDLLAEAKKFPVITALEVIEHVPDPQGFLATLAGLLEPGGLLFVSTLNRTPQSYAVAKLGAEYLLRLLPVGTHDWRKFITPAELGVLCRSSGLRLADVAGLVPAPLAGGFRASRNTSVNYIAMAQAA
ncbi:bifunctional 2-polyprenyl-6-hydroxyphenol methylase/3-demethylubiquinol 3-O-methyltransferase UbiG [Acidiphilium sp. AL]|uniref:Ubiquinone biosynthesis O-methyltransferase n=1 Tax=Acidiphilium iwatense TaxID=768198 RepID=A0ABS9DYU1_9PROT|nr:MULTISPECIES: bifunctional 2-polyprenyl-6-hydroxyphenol methylase/3-demethylubiquinol 3-O-methyltransferase UbiG [Acidiphilium]MCF3946499.1 bifunctional 2-polyprenyl-6-hydroxyphenol methylase/3-demethylubiquinol 3-O-methyltransferase UbiG [Acidiphilium iwatense]MCU4158669.1 bifunctional 2-polyprenyl-6-hydroxyphenol methylase/3-demethylubiquinol 3-O-methyltransferase UbiG [Acidiphilium sp. AL]